MAGTVICSTDGCERDAVYTTAVLCRKCYTRINAKPLTPERLAEKAAYTAGRRAARRAGDALAHAADTWRANLWSYHRTTPEEYVSQEADQGGVCALCGKTCMTGRRLAIDHDHECCPGKRSCGKCRRGLLCGKCNQGLGLFDDDPALLLKAAEYLTSKGVW